MSVPSGASSADTSPRRPAIQVAVPIGDAVIDLLEVAYRTRRPVLLEGPTGIGKSQISAEFAARHGLAFTVLDLSLLEPPDLVGLPVVRDGRTHYASPSELPTTGSGVLMLEELNRAELPVMQPALQLLSARRLHAYELPPGWMCVAAVNPEDDEYQVNHLDAALRSRFLQLEVCADRDLWLAWGARTNVHPVIQQLVREHVDAFDEASPRSWAYASDLLHALGPDELRREALTRPLLRGHLPPAWARLVVEALAGTLEGALIDLGPLLAADGVALLSARVKQLSDAGRLDAIAMLAARLRHQLKVAAASVAPPALEQLEALFAALPGDLRDQCLDTAVESPWAPAFARALAIDPARIVHEYTGSAVQSLVRNSRKKAQLHRARLVTSSVETWLRANPEATPLAKQRAPSQQLEALVADAGAASAQDLARWLRANGPGKPR